jgi:hypothetical protein
VGGLNLGEEDRFKKLRAVYGEGWVEDVLVRDERKKSYERTK